jgi:hypothetical protein
VRATPETRDAAAVREGGVALPVAVLALVVVGALVAGAFWAATEEQRAGEMERLLSQAFGLAELGGLEAVRTWVPSGHARLATYPADSAPIPAGEAAVGAGGGSYRGYLYRLNEDLYFIDVTGQDAASGRPTARGPRVQ